MPEEDQIQHILTEAENAMAEYVTPDGKARFATSAQLITGTTA